MASESGRSAMPSNRHQIVGSRSDRDEVSWSRLIAILLSIWLAPSLAATPLWCRTLGVENGLSQSWAGSIAEDRDGFIWIGTLGGLSRWDGHQFVRYAHDPGSERSLSDSVVLALHRDRAGRLWVGTRLGLDEYDAGSGEFVRRRVAYEEREAAGARVDAITSDRAGRIWVSSIFQGQLYRYDPLTGRGMAIRLPGRQGDLVTALHIDRSDRLWVGMRVPGSVDVNGRRRHRLMVLDRCSEHEGGEGLTMREAVKLDDAGGRVSCLLDDLSDRLWIGREGGGVLRLDPVTQEERSIPSRGLGGGFVLGGALGPDGAIWFLRSFLPTEDAERRGGLVRVDAEDMTVRRFDGLGSSSPTWNDAKPISIAVDRSGVVWVGSNGGGVAYADVGTSGFEVFRRRSAVADGLNNSFVRAICIDHTGAVWVGTPRGLNRVERSAEGIRYRSSPGEGFPDLEDPNVQAVYEDRRHRLWVATPAGLVVSDPLRGTKCYRHEPGNADSLIENRVQVIHEDKRGRLWFGTLGAGVDLFDEAAGVFRHAPPDPKDPSMLPNGSVHSVFSDRAGTLWVGVVGGLARLEESGAVRRFHRVAGLEGKTVMSIAQSEGLPDVLWVGTQQHGLCRVDLRDESCRFFTTRNSGLPDDTVYGVLTDSMGRLWLSSNQGLACLDPGTEVLDLYGVEHGLQSSEFNSLAFARSSDGELFFGGIGGMNAFRPELIERNPHPPRILITSVSIADRGATKLEAGTSLIFRNGTDPAVLEEIPYRKRDLTFDYVALHHSAPERNLYEYRLDDFDNGWSRPVAQRRVRYTNLDPGLYTFRVRAVSGHGVRSVGESTYTFRILPPIHGTLWFRFMACTGVLGAILGGYQIRLRAVRRRQIALEREVEQRTAELRAALATVEGQARRLESLDSVKSKFFANISHEFRTPLMLTLGPLRDVKAGMHGPVTADAQDEIGLALRNAGRLLELVDQLLMLARFDAGEQEFRPQRLRLDEHLRSIAETHRSIAQRCSVDFAVDLPGTAIFGDYDPGKLDQIVGNLLSNAIKFTPPGGFVALRMSASFDGWGEIVVEDTGPGIPEQDLPRIFDRFYRGEQQNGSLPGTGLGLALARECVELHGGFIDAENMPTGGARFTVRLRSVVQQEDAATAGCTGSPR